MKGTTINQLRISSVVAVVLPIALLGCSGGTEGSRDSGSGEPTRDGAVGPTTSDAGDSGKGGSGKGGSGDGAVEGGDANLGPGATGDSGTTDAGITEPVPEVLETLVLLVDFSDAPAPQSV